MSDDDNVIADLNFKSVFLDKLDKRLVNRIKIRARRDFIQFWIDNRSAGYAGIRLYPDQIDQLIQFLNKVRTEMD